MSRSRTTPSDLRRHPRRRPGRAEPIARVRLRTGSEMTVVDISDAGALLEGSARLLPGTHVDAHIVSRDGRVLVRSGVVRAYVCHVQKDAVRYRAALSFERTVDTSAHGYLLPGPMPGSPGTPGSGYPNLLETESARGDETL